MARHFRRWHFRRQTFTGLSQPPRKATGINDDFAVFLRERSLSCSGRISSVTGRVKKVKTVPGLFFAAPTPDQDYAASFPFLSHVNTRTIVFIESQDSHVGEIALIFVGLTEVSSCCERSAVNERNQQFTRRIR